MTVAHHKIEIYEDWTMKMLARTLLSALLVIGLLTGCDSEPAAEEPSTDQVAEPEVQEDDPADDGEVIAEDGEEDIALEGGQWVESDLYGVKFRVPDNWEVARADDAISATDPDGSTTVILGGSESDQSLQNAISRLRDDLEFTDVKFESNDLTTINAFAATRGRGSAVLVREDDIDEEIQFLGYALRVGSKNVTMLIFSEATMYEAMRDIIDGIAHTITRS